MAEKPDSQVKVAKITALQAVMVALITTLGGSVAKARCGYSMDRKSEVLHDLCRERWILLIGLRVLVMLNTGKS